MSRDSKELIVGLDIGTTKIVALVAEINPEGRLNIIGMGSQDSRGLKKGVVVNIEDTVATISRVIFRSPRSRTPSCSAISSFTPVTLA